MKRKYYMIFAVFVLVCMVLPASADTRSDEVLSNLSAKIRSLGNYRVEFAAAAEGNDFTGEYFVSRDRYTISVADMEVVCDGKTKYEINHALEEVIIDKVNPNDKNLLSNPTKAFDFAGDNFAHEFKGRMQVEGRMCDVVILTPTQKYTGMKNIALAVDAATGLPHVIRYSAEGLSEDIEITVKTIVGNITAPDSAFSFNSKKYKGYELVDFR